MDATQLLQNDHDAVRGLFDAIEGAGDDAETRRDLFAQLAEELRIHSRIEEEIFYPRVQRLGRDDDDEGDDLVTEAVKEHHQVDRLLRDIEALDASGSAWTRRVKKLRHRVEHHADEEENEMFAFVRENMPDEEREHLGQELEVRKAALNPRAPQSQAV